MKKYKNLVIPKNSHTQGEKRNSVMVCISVKNEYTCSGILCAECLFSNENQNIYEEWNNIIIKKNRDKSRKVRAHLMSGKSLTDLQCLDLYLYKRLSDIVCKLRVKLKDENSDYYIDTIMRQGKTGEYAEYQLKMKNDEV